MAVIQRVSNRAYSNWALLMDAIEALMATGAYWRLLGHHRMIYRAHGSMGAGEEGYRRFLPWHRAYLIQFERALRSVDDSLSIPYWDWDGSSGGAYRV